MSSLNAVIFVVAILLVCNYVSADSGRCPPPSKVFNNKPTCHSDADCQKWGKVCCRNQFNTMSCVDRAPWSSGAAGSGNNNKYTSVGGLCDGVRCKPYEVCKPDPITKRLKCQRA